MCNTIVHALRALPDVVSEIRSYSVGSDQGLAEGNYDLVIVADFDDVDGFAAYNANVEHQRVITELIRPVIAARSAVQYVVS